MTERIVPGLGLLRLSIALLMGVASVQAANSPPSQVYYVPVPENDQLSGYASVSSVAVDPLHVFVTFTAASDQTVIYYDHWEDGYEKDITNPTQSSTLILGDGNSANGYPPGNAGDLITAGTIFSLRNYVNSTTGASAFKYDARDKVASFKPISLTKTSFPSSTNTLLAGCVEVFERGIWGTDYRVPIGTNMPTSAAAGNLTFDYDIFAYTSLSIMAGAGGATVQIDGNNDGIFEQTVTLAEGGSSLVSNVSVGARVLADKPVQVVLFTGRPGSNYQSRDTSLLPVNRWSNSYHAPVSTVTTNGTTVFLYNPGTSAITVSYDYRSSLTAYTTATVSVPAGGNARVNLSPASGTTHYGAYRFYTTGTTPPNFYAFCAVDAASTVLTENQAYDGGFTLVGQPSLTTQILVSLGIGRDPYSTTNPAENGNPVWVTTAGNAHTAATVYVDYNGDNAGPNVDPNGNRYDVSYSVRELQQLKLFDPDGDQSGMLVYTLNPAVKLAAAWAQDPSVASPGQPGLDVSTLVPPLREGDGAKGSSLAIDADGDGFISAGDTLEYDLRAINTARSSISGPFTVRDTLPTDLTYEPGTARFRYSVNNAWQAWTVIPDDVTGTPFPFDGTGYAIPGTLAVKQQIQVTFQATIKPYANLTAGATQITNSGSIVMTPFGVTVDVSWSDLLYGSIGDRVWADANGNGIQDSGEAGLNNVRVYLDLNNNGTRDANEPTSITAGDGGYVFNGLLAGTYRVRVDPSSVAAINPGYGPTYDIDGISTSYVALATLASAQDRVDVDFGFRIGASVGDRVWLDRDGDGVQEPGEPGINGVRVYIDLNGNSTFDSNEPNSFTTGDGDYFIGNLAAGTYTVRVDTTTLPSGATQTFDAVTPLDNAATVTLVGATHRAEFDFGYRGNLSIGDQVWNDVDGNGLLIDVISFGGNGGMLDMNRDGTISALDAGQLGGYNVIAGRVDVDGDGDTDNDDNITTNTFMGLYRVINGRVDINLSNTITTADVGRLSGEQGIANVRVYIDVNGDGVFNAIEPSAVTNASGIYSITNLFNGSYTVRVDTTTIPNSFVQTYDLTAPVTDHQATVVLSGSSRLDVDYGYRNDASIGDLVWNDRDGNGVVNAGEPGIEGVLVYIDANGNDLFDQATERFAFTNNAGYYNIPNLPAGSYIVRVEISTLPAGATQTYDLDGTATANRAVRTLTTSEDAVNVDFGYRASASVGDFVWNDANANGIQDSGEAGIANVRVYLDINGNGVFDSATEPSALTSAAGAYTIGNLLPGTYTARIDTSTLAATLVQTYDASGILDHAATFSLSATQVRTDIDFGYTTRVTIGDFVWSDLNANGQQDSGEPGIAGVTVTAFNASNNTIAATTTTNSAGAYSFLLMPGTYYLVFDRPDGYQATLADRGSDNTDSDANPVTGRTINVTLTGGQSNLTFDAGFYQPVTIGDFVWSDLNANGQQDSGEPGLAGVSVTLFRPGFGPDGIAGTADDATSIGVATTGSDGAYSFTGLPPGTYQITFGALAGYNRTLMDRGADATDSDASASTGQTATFAVAAGVTNNSIDAGYYAPVSIGDFVWNDVNGNGQQDSGEVGLSGVLVSLFRPGFGPDGISGTSDDAAVVATATTGSNGAYSFTGLPPGTYQVSFGTLAGYNRTRANQGAAATDSDANASTGLTPAITLEAGTTNNTIDAGYYVPASIGDFVWSDTNANGQQDSGEPGLAGVTVSLYRPGIGPDGIAGNADDDSALSSTTTGSSGAYSFSSLAPGTYRVGFGTLAGYGRTLAGQGAAATDSDADAATGLTANIVLAAGQTNNAIDAGYFQSGTIGDFVWNDVNANGQQDSGEPGLAGVTVSLFRPGFGPDGIAGNADDASVVATAVSNASGAYSFTGLRPGTYRLTFGTLAGYGRTITGQGTPPTDSNANVSTGETGDIVLSAGQTNSTVDAGYYQTTAIGDFVWNDSNANGQQDSGEPGLAGVTVSLYRPGFGPDGIAGNADDGTALTSVVTGISGAYSFSGLAPGTYQVGFGTLAGYGRTIAGQGAPATDSDADAGTGLTANIVLSPGQTNNAIDAGYFQSGSIGDFVWNDVNANGQQDSGELGLAGVTVSLFRPGFGPDGIPGNADDATVVATVVSNASGAYSFTGLRPGTYRVTFGALAGYGRTLTGQGTAATDSNADATTGQTGDIVLAAGQSNTTIDAGYFQSVAIGDFVWNDANANGQQDSGELGLAGVTVSLYRPGFGPDGIAGNTDDGAILTSVVTGSNGAYAFTGLAPGTYQVGFGTLAGYGRTLAGQGAAATDSDANAGTGLTGNIVLTPGQTNNAIDAGYYQTGSIGDFVWNDANANGQQDSGELGLAGIMVSLYRPGFGPDGIAGNADDGNVLSSVVTGANGAYSFSGLAPGTYQVGFGTLAGYGRTIAGQGAAATDSDANAGTGLTGNIVLAPGQTNNAIDAGYFQSGSIGDFVWNDANANGQQDSGELGLAGVTVSLYRPGFGPDGIPGNADDATVVATAVSNASGAYSFAGLRPGTYRVIFGALSGYGRTLTGQGTATTDSNANPATGETGDIVLAAGQSNTTIDAGYYQTVAIGDFVWNDANANGQQDSGELGLAGITVSLYRPGFGPDGIAGNADDAAILTSVVTGSNGAYAFTGLAPGTYQVGFGTLAGYGRTIAGQGAAATDSDANAGTGLTGNIVLTPGQTNNAIDAGYFQSGSIGDFVWNDANANGQQDSGELGLAGITVSLYRPGFGPDGIPGNADDGNVLSSVVTGANGAYSFTGLAPGTYQVGFGTLAGYGRTIAGQGAAATDSDANAGTGLTGNIVLAPGQTNNAIDAGYFQSGSIGDFVWNDANANGQQDSGELGLAGITVSLYRPGFGPDGIPGNADDGNVLSSVVTGANGAYSFSGLAPGTYQVGFGTLAGYGRTIAGQGAAATDSDANPGTGLTGNIVLTPGQTNNAIDAGYFQSITIGDFVWNDVNANGQQDSGELGLAGVTVSLYRPGFGPDGIPGNADDAAVVATVVTGANGAYSFTGRPPGTYQVGFGALVGYNRTAADQGADATDSDANVTTGLTGTFTVAPGATNNSIDAGYYAPASIGNFVWNDLNANGQQDSGEPGLAGITVNLFRPGFGPDGIAGNADDGNVLASVVSDSNGAYSFGGLAPGTYQVGFGTLSGYGRTLAGQGAAATDSDANAANGITGNIVLAAGQTNNAIDAGYFQSVTIGDFVWNDVNANGQQDSGETGLSGVTVSLYRPGFGPDGISGTPDDAAVVASVVTGANGAYSFTGVPPGTYQVGFGALAGYNRTPADQGPNATDSDANVTTGLSSTFTLAAGATNNTIDAGYYAPASIGDFVWNDLNANGQQDSGEPGLAGVTVSLYRPGFGPDGIAGNADDGSPLSTTTTSGGGAYSFGGLAPGTYQVGFGTLLGYGRTLASTGAGATDSDANATTGMTGNIVLVAGQTNNAVDAGYFQSGIIGDFVWNDANANGQQDSGEPGLAGVTVSLFRPGFGPDGIPGNADDAAVVATTISNGSGAYSFTGLRPGTYTLTFGELAGYGRTLTGQGTSTTDSDANVLTGETGNIVLTPGQTNTSVDAGYYQTGSIGDFVWNDSNANGRQDSGEAGLAGVSVSLFRPGFGPDGIPGNADDGTALATVVTNSNGAYSFSGLAPGDYQVGFGALAGYNRTLANQDTDSTDSDANPANGLTAIFTLAAGQNNSSVDAGYYAPVTIGSFVWNDVNANGRQDSGEAGLAGVTVSLFRPGYGPDGVAGTADDAAAVATVITDSNGAYSFASLPPGNYQVGFGALAGYSRTPANQGSDDGDSDANTSTGLTTIYTLAAGQTNNTIDAGYYAPASIGNFVWNDVNANGQQDSGELGLAGVTVSLYRPGFGPDGIAGNADDSSALASTTTGASGAYSFGGLAPGTYQIGFGALSGYNRSIANQGPAATDSDANATTGLSGNIVLTAGQTDNTIDAGYYQPGSISGLVLADTDNDDIGDSPIAGVILTLLGSDGNPVDGNPAQPGVQPVTTISAANGSYTFSNLIPGVYGVSQTQPAGYNSISDSDGGDVNEIYPITVVAGQTSTGNNFVEEEQGTISGSVFADTDYDGDGDAPLAGVVIRLLDSNGDPVLDGNGDPVTTVTAANGSYSFSGLTPGSYQVAQVQPVNYASVGDSDGANDNIIGLETPIIVSAGGNSSGNNFVEVQLGSISGSVLADIDNNGSGDAPLVGVVLTLYYGNGQPVLDGNGDPVQAVTNSSGIYTFPGLLPGSYRVSQTQPVGYGSVSDVDGANNNVIGDQNPIVVTPGQAVTGRNFVEIQFGSISGSVLADTDHDGIGDAPLAGVTIGLADEQGNPVLDGTGQPITTVTLADGSYVFTSIYPGNYQVIQVQPSGYNSVGDSDGANNNIIGDENPIEVLPGVDNGGNDFVEEQPGVISGSVLVDTDGNGSGDAPLAGVTLALLDSNGNPVLDGNGQPVTTVSQADGSYSFTGVVPGDYRVTQLQPVGYGSVSDSDGANNNVIGDETPITVTAGGASTGNNFVEVQLGSISGFVLADTDNDGDGDTGLSGVVVRLLDSNGNPVLNGSGQPIQTTTGANGGYSFSGLFPGSYRVAQVQPSGYGSVSDVDGANNNVIGDETPIIVGPGQSVTGRNFVEIEFGSIAGTVLDDTDASGSGDAPLAGVIIGLYNGSGQPILDGSNQPVTTTTAADGSYFFGGLFPGSYQIREIQPTGYGSVSDVDGGNPDIIGNIIPLVVAPGQEVVGRDFVDVKYGSITGFVRVGADPLVGVTLTLLDASGDPVDGNPNIPGVQLVTAVTDSNGRYVFNNVMPGNYGVAQTQPVGYNSFGDSDGGDLDIIGDVTPITVLPGQENSGNNFVEVLDTCPDTWAEWLFQNPGQTADGNPDSDRYDNLNEFAFAMPANSGAGDAWRILPSTTSPGTIDGVFTRPKGAYQNVVYSLEFLNSLVSPIVWQSFEIEASMVTIVDNGDCTETVTLRDLETLTGLSAGEGFVRIRADLDEDLDDTIDHTSYTEVEGWKDTGFEICCRTYNNPFLRDSAFTGSVTGVSGQTLDLSGSAGTVDVSSLMTAGAYYVEVVSGDNEGHRFDVVSATATTITLANDTNLDSASAPYNTRAGALPANLSGDEIVLRRHWTLDEMFPPAGFGATNSPATADQVQLFAGGQWITFWLFDGGPQPSRWVNIMDGTYANQGSFVLPPGYGAFFNNRHAPTSLLAYGEVRVNDFVRPLGVGSNLVSGGYPLDQSAAGANGRQMTVASGFFGSRDIATADTIFVWKEDSVIGSAGYASYFLNDNTPRVPRVIKWAKVGDASLLSRDSENLMLGNRSVFVRSKNGLNTYTMPSPWAP